MLRSSFFLSLCTGIIVLLAGCGTQSVSKIQPNTSPAPTVVGIANQVDGVAPNRAIGVVFSEPMNPKTINAQTFYIQGVSGAVTYDAASNIATLTPDHSLEPSTKYTAIVTTGAMSQTGVPMAQSYTFSFTTRATADNSPVKVMSTTPANGTTCADVNTKISVIFSEGVDPSTIDGASFYISGVQGTVTYDAINIIAIFTPSAPLQPNTAYTGTLTTAIKDLAGNALPAPYIFSFATGPCGGGGGGADSGTEFLYVGDNLSLNAIHGYVADPASATVSRIPGSPFAEGGTGPDTLAVSKNFLYAAAQGVIPNSNPPFPANTSSIVQYRTDPATGVLTQLGSLTLASANYLVADPTGQNLYVGDNSGSILTLKINTDGTLTNTGMQVHLPAVAGQIVISPNGQLLYTIAPVPSNPTEEQVLAISRDTTTGALTFDHQVATGNYLTKLRFDPSGHYLLISSTNSISVYSVSYSNGNLSPVPGSPFVTPRSVTSSSDFIRTFQLDPTGQFVYALSASGPNFNSEYVTVFALSQATGTLLPVQTFATPIASDPTALVVGQSLVFVVNTSAGPSRPATIQTLKRDPTTGMLSAGGTPLTSQAPLQTAIMMQF